VVLPHKCLLLQLEPAVVLPHQPIAVNMILILILMEDMAIFVVTVPNPQTKK
jgi:hypothetical protein